MADFKKFVRQVEKARRRAATFHKVDLHVHSFESHDFPKLGDKINCATQLTEADQAAKPEDFIAAAKGVTDLRLIAITDHNCSRVSAEISRLSDPELVALPGIEVTLQTSIFPDSRVHILAIFPENLASEDIEKIFPVDCGMPNYDDRDRGSIAKIPVDIFIEQVHKSGGVCIAGHVNSTKGVRRTLFLDNNVQRLKIVMRIKELEKRKEKNHSFNESDEQVLQELKKQFKKVEDDTQNRYLEFLSKYRFDAVEVQKSEDEQYYTGIHTEVLGIRPIPCVLGSDAHNLQDIGLKGSTTYIKMTKPSFRDLRQALRDPGTRVRYEDTVPRNPVPRILGVCFSGGFFQQQALGFSDNLTCLIGGRGTGKSAAIEALRFAFAHELNHLPDEKRDDIDKRKQHTLKDTSIEVLYIDQNGEQYVLKREYGETIPTCHDVDGTKRDEIDVSVSSNLDVKIYGWGEIEELARNKREQLKLVDGFIPEAQDLRHKINELMEDLKANTRRIVSLTGQVEQLLPRIAELPAKKAELDRLSTEEIDEMFADFDRNEAANSTIKSFSSTLSKLKEVFIGEDAEKPRDLADEVKQSFDKGLSNLQSYDWSKEFNTQIEEQAAELQRRYISLLAQFDVLKKTLNEKATLLGTERKTIETSLNQQVEQMEEDDIQVIIRRRRQLATEVSELQAIRDEINDKQVEIEELLEKRTQEIVPKLQSQRQKLTEARQIKIETINQRLEQLSTSVKVSIQIQHQKYREDFRLKLGAPESGAPTGVLKGVYKWYKRDNYAGHYANHHSPHTFVQAILKPGDHSSLCIEVTENETTHEAIGLSQAKRVAQHLSPYIEEGKPHFDEGKLKQLLELEHLDIEDLVTIHLDGRPIEELSPGQRCSTLIPIILLESDSPLVIDQPEDNLDNKLVFDLVVNILRSLKQRRQIIVATHNPNVPVSGDAEQIVVFEAPSRELCQIVHQGSIDDERIIEKVKTIMEGSEEAFRIRAEKYGYRLDYV